MMTRIQTLVEDNLPPELLVQIVEGVRDGYVEADLTFTKFEEPERQNGIGVQRKLEVDGRMRAIFNAFPDPAVRAEVVPNSKQSSRMSLLWTRRLLLTPATTQSPQWMPPTASFREHLIEGQMDFFRAGGLREDAFVYAIIAHGAFRVEAAGPDWLRLLFPDKASGRLACEPIDLFALAQPPRIEEGSDEDDLGIALREDPDAEQDAEQEEDQR